MKNKTLIILIIVCFLFSGINFTNFNLMNQKTSSFDKGLSSSHSLSDTKSKLAISSPWENFTSLNVPDCGFAQTYHGRIYFVGSSGVYSISPGESSWTLENPTGVGYQGYRGDSVIIDDGIYIYNGWGQLQVYHINTNSFTTLQSPNKIRIDVALAELNGLIYASGGWVNGNSTGERTVEVYNPNNNSWNYVKEMNLGRINHETVTAEGFIYAIGGQSSFSDPILQRVERYNASLNEWQFVNNISAYYSEFGSVSTDDGRLIIFDMKQSHTYNISTDTWSQELPVSNPISFLFSNSLTILNDTVYSIGARDSPGNYYNYTRKARIYDQPRTITDNIKPTATFVSSSLVDSSQTNNLAWYVQDNYPNNYSIYVNNSLMDFGKWSSHTNITYSLGNTPYGVYNFTLKINDLYDNQEQLSNIVRITDLTAPTLSPESNMTLEIDVPNQEISWSPYDVNPNNYQIERNGTVIQSGQWSNFIPISHVITADTLSIYNYTITVWDNYNNNASNSVFITIQDTLGPSIIDPVNINFNINDTSNQLVWTLYDHNPDMYQLYMNQVFLKGGSWTNGESITYNVDTSNYNSFIFTIYTNDTLGNTKNSTINVNIIDNQPPVISELDNITITYGTNGNFISLDVWDDFPNGYYVLVDNQADSGHTWDNTEPISYNIDGLSVGEHNITFVVFDQNYNMKVYSVYVKVVQENTSQPSNETTGSSEASTASNSQKTTTSSINTSGLDLEVVILTILLCSLIFTKRRQKKT
ncbi:MAG: hypothetical protein ACFFD1_03605 [Candidatus Thorarchaeota archaeon]